MTKEVISKTKQYVIDSNTQRNKDIVKQSLKDRVIDERAYYTAEEYMQLDRGFKERWELLKTSTVKNVRNILKNGKK